MSDMWRWSQKGNLLRFPLIRTPWFRIFLHRIPRGDFDRYMHNHPWVWCMSLILRGGFTEIRRSPGSVCQQWISYSRWSVVRWSKDTFHRILAVDPGTLTLFIAGPRTGKGWGFDSPCGFIPGGE